MTLVDYGPTLHTPYVLKLKLWWISSVHRNETSGIMRRVASAEKNDAYKSRLQSAATRAIVTHYRQRRREERRLIRRKKRLQERHEREEIEM